MEVILLEKIDKLGAIGEVVSVKSGYARNYLIPFNKALRATEENKKKFEEQKTRLQLENEQNKSNCQTTAEQITGRFITLIRQAGEDGRLFGSASAKDIADAAGKQLEINVTNKQIFLAEPIKYLGIYEIEIRLHPEVVANIVLNIARSTDEASESQKLYEVGEWRDPRSVANNDDIDRSNLDSATLAAIQQNEAANGSINQITKNTTEETVNINDTVAMNDESAINVNSEADDSNNKENSE